MAVRFLFLILALLTASVPSLFTAPLATTITYFPGPVPLTEEEVMENKDRKIIRFDIVGVERENRHIIRSIVDLKPGDHLASLDLGRMRSQLETTELFSQIGLFFRPNREGYVITLRVKEKKEFIILPFFTLSRSDVHTGGALSVIPESDTELQSSETEAGQTGGVRGIIRYSNPHFQGQPQDMEVTFKGDRLLQTHARADAEVIRQFKGYSANLDMDWRFRNDSRFSPSVMISYDLFEVDTGWKEAVHTPQTAEMVATGVELVYRNYYLLHYFDDGFQTALRLNQKYLLQESENIFSIHLTADWNSNPVFQHRLHAGIRGGYNPVSPVLLEFLRGPGHFLLPATRSVDRLYFSGTLEYEVPVHYNPWGTLTAFIFAESGLYSPLEEEYELYYGPGLGFHLYVHGLSSPVIGATLGINMDAGYISSSFYAGIQL
ncbi:MAG: hypothetical protein SVR04_12265 [Spirochaetota bacterium]|nr:hypothetical protein [Spirochaetota bacterium]